MTQIPKVLYKFRDWTNRYNRRIVVESELYLSNNFSFNDPFDLQLPSIFKGKVEFNEKNFIKFFSTEYGNNPPQELIDEVKIGYPLDVNGKSDFAKESRKRLENDLAEVENSLGVFCASQNNNNTLMWGHYSNSHYGFCIGLDGPKLYQFLKDQFQNKVDLLKVDYISEIPILEDFNNYNSILKYAISRFTSKFEQWQYEEEYRIIIIGMSNKAIKIPSEIYKEMIFGYKMDPTQEKEIKIICEKLYPNIKYYKANPNKKAFEMEIMPLKNK